mmetsp:Transcript_13136/g.18592  ORF Transcript_13136/g.18592 Transcript_13136/m.18592 type:complete len:196 (+) Transcript_13136:285-872(+)
MFLPTNSADQTKKDAEEKLRREAFTRIEGWALNAIPSEIREGVEISAQEVQCGDPNCAPIDTAITILFPSGGRGMMGLPMEAKDVTEEELQHAFPTKKVLEAWHRGEEAEWPPEPDFSDPSVLPDLRFELGTRVKCRIGPDPVTGWAKGEVIQLWYREANWPPQAWAPYKIRLDDGRDIFAPGDMDQVIMKDEEA